MTDTREPRMIDPRDLSVAYDADIDFLYIHWSKEPGVYDNTDNERVLNYYNDDGEIIGVMIQGTRKIEGPPIEFTLDKKGAQTIIKVKKAAEELGISESRVHTLLRQGRIKGAHKVGATWLIPSPIDLTTGTRGPTGVAGKRKRRRTKAAA